jgi:O-antigen/teichoic acid export membrane protein
MKQKFISNLFFLILANLVVKPFWIFGIDRHLQNTIDTEQYGAYFAVFNFSFLLHIILDGGINSLNNIEVAKDPNYLKNNLSNIFYLKLLLSICYVGITLAIAGITSFDSDQLHMLFILMINMILLNLILFFRSNVAALHFFKTDSILSILDRFLAILFCVLLIYFNHFSIHNFIYAQTFALFITLITSAIIVYRIGKPKLTKLEKNIFFSILKNSYPFAILGILMTIYYRVDAVMIEQILPNGKEQAGIYAASYRLLDALNMLAYLVASILLPMFSKNINNNEIQVLKKLIIMSSGFLLLASLSTFIIAYFYSDWILAKLYLHALPQWSYVFWSLLFSFIPISLTYVFGTFLTANKNILFMNVLSFIALIINVLLNFILIPRHQALGACIATGVTQVFVIIFQISFVIYLFYFSSNKLNHDSTLTTTS